MPRIEHKFLAHIACDDPEVREFVEDEFWNIGPYSQPEHVRNGQEIFDAAKKRFGLVRMLGVEWRIE
jgi:hypothetical protein